MEKRERRIRTVEASREAEYTTKMAEVELKQKLLKEETKHAAELEVSIAYIGVYSLYLVDTS